MSLLHFGSGGGLDFVFEILDDLVLIGVEFISDSGDVIFECSEFRAASLLKTRDFGVVDSSVGIEDAQQVLSS